MITIAFSCRLDSRRKQRSEDDGDARWLRWRSYLQACCCAHDMAQQAHARVLRWFSQKSFDHMTNIKWSKIQIWPSLTPKLFFGVRTGFTQALRACAPRMQCIYFCSGWGYERQQSSPGHLQKKHHASTKGLDACLVAFIDADVHSQHTHKPWTFLLHAENGSASFLRPS